MKVSSVTEVTSIGSCVSSHEDLDYGPNTPDAKWVPFVPPFIMQHLWITLITNVNNIFYCWLIIDYFTLLSRIFELGFQDSHNFEDF